MLVCVKTVIRSGSGFERSQSRIRQVRMLADSAVIVPEDKARCAPPEVDIESLQALAGL